MNAPIPNQRRFEQLFQDLEDGCISGPDHAELMNLLRSHPRARRKYIRHMRFSSLLYTRAEAIAELEGAPEIPAPLALGRQLFNSTLLAAAVVALGAFISSFFIPPDPPPATVKASPDSVWSFARGGIDEHKRFMPSTTLAVEGGSLEVQLESGSRFIVEGPARVYITSPNEIRMPFGRVWVRAESEHFIVQTQRLKVLDLGTEFGVSAFRELDEEVHVAKGRVRVIPKVKTLATQELTVGQAVRADPIGRLRHTAYDASRFQTRLPDSVTYIHWSFDKAGAEGFPSSGEGIPSAPMAAFSLDQRDIALTVAPSQGRFGGALTLDQADHFAKADFTGIEGNVPRTVAFWVKAQATDSDQTIPFVSWGNSGGDGHKWVVACNPEGTRMTVGWGGTWIQAETFSEASFLDGRWHHLCYVFSGHTDAEGRSEVIQYLDGEALAIRNPGRNIPVNTDCGAKNSWPLTIGTQLWSTPLRPTFNGSIDELYIFRSALNPIQVRHLMEHNRLTSSPEQASAPSKPGR